MSSSVQLGAEELFTGKERDTESGNDYFGARYYSENDARFMSPDWSAKVEPVPYAKLDDPQSLNLYGYMLDSPLDGVDQDGHCPICVYALEIGLAAAGGAVVSMGVEAGADIIAGKHITKKGLEIAAAKGAVTGAVAGATEGASLVSETAYQAGANFIGGVIGRGIAGKKETVKNAIGDAVSGAAGPLINKVGRGAGAVINGKSSEEIEGRIGSKMGARHVKSLTRQAAAARRYERRAGKAAERAAETASEAVLKKRERHENGTP